MARPFRLVTLLGIRPDYIRMHRAIAALDAASQVDHILVHSGQHYDPELYGVFLTEFQIRPPDLDLKVGTTLKERGESSHAHQLALLTERVFDMIGRLHPDAVMYLGDTNTVLSAPTVARCGVPVIHVEAGGRSFDWRMPEEKNRIVIDHMSDALYAYLDRYRALLVAEGVDSFRIEVIGNIIVDAVREYGPRADESDILARLGVQDARFILLTLHREENISAPGILARKLMEIARFAADHRLPVVFPVMPRVQAALDSAGMGAVVGDAPYIPTGPLGFFDFLKLEKAARLIVSDSGTVQEEALLVGTPCAVCRRSTERPETIWAGATVLEGMEEEGTLYEAVARAFALSTTWDRSILNPLGGSPSDRLVADLLTKIGSEFFARSRSYDAIAGNRFAREAYPQ